MSASLRCMGGMDFSTLGQDLRNLCRQIERREDDPFLPSPQLRELLVNLSAACSRRGLLQGDITEAREVLKSSNDVMGKMMSGGRKRRRSGGASSNASGQSEGNSELSSAAAHRAILSALGRILGGSGDNENKTTNQMEDISHIVNLAARALTAMVRYCIVHGKSSVNTPSACVASAEATIFASSSRELLQALARACQEAISKTMDNPEKEEGFEHADAAASCLCAASCIIRLLGTKLSRSSSNKSNSTSSISILSSAALSLLFHVPSSLVNDNHITSASVYLASLPLAGRFDGTPPSKLWSTSMAEATSSLLAILYAFGPPPTFSSRRNQGRATSSTEQILKLLEPFQLSDSSPNSANFVVAQDTAQCISSLSTTLLTQMDRKSHFQRRMSSLTLLICCLLDSECMPPSSLLPLGQLLTVAELMLAMPSTSEARWNATKPRLRDVPFRDQANNNGVGGGALSPQSAFSLSFDVTLVGHRLLQTVLSTLDPSSAQLVAWRLLRMTVAALQSSCTPAAKLAIDPTSSMMPSQKGSSRQLAHTWIPWRCASIQSFGDAVVILGSASVFIGPANHEIMAGKGHNATAMGPIARGLLLVCGCLLEQTLLYGDEQEKGAENSDVPPTDWGTLSERVDLVKMGANTIGACVAACGGYLPLDVRMSIDSVTSQCLWALHHNSKNNNAMMRTTPLQCASVQQSLLQLGSHCLWTPRNDGASADGTIILLPLRLAAQTLLWTNDGDVAGTARSTLASFHAMMTPRAPPLAIVTRRITAPAITEPDQNRKVFVGRGDCDDQSSNLIQSAEGIDKRQSNDDTLPEQTDTSKTVSLADGDHDQVTKNGVEQSLNLSQSTETIDKKQSNDGDTLPEQTDSSKTVSPEDGGGDHDRESKNNADARQTNIEHKDDMNELKETEDNATTNSNMQDAPPNNEGITGLATEEDEKNETIHQQELACSSTPMKESEDDTCTAGVAGANENTNSQPKLGNNSDATMEVVPDHPTNEGNKSSKIVTTKIDNAGGGGDDDDADDSSVPPIVDCDPDEEDL